MTVLQLVPVMLSALLLGAHFLRSGEIGMVLVALSLLPLLWIPRPWAARVVQAGLVLGALEWVRTLLALVAARQAMGMPYERMALILGGVAVFTLLSALLFQTHSLRRRFGLGGPPCGPPLMSPR